MAGVPSERGAGPSVPPCICSAATRSHTRMLHAPTMPLRSRKELLVQLKSSGGSQPFSALQCRTAFPGGEERHGAQPRHGAEAPSHLG